MRAGQAVPENYGGRLHIVTEAGQNTAEFADAGILVPHQENVSLQAIRDQQTLFLPAPRRSIAGFAHPVPDFVKIMRILRDTQFPGSICPDHMPTHPDDPGGLQAFAFGYGYINALIQAVNSEV